MVESATKSPPPRRAAPVATLSGSDVLAILAALSRLGLDQTALCASIGLDASGLLEPETRIPQNLVVSLLREAERQTKDPAIALRITEKLTVGVSGSVPSKLGMASGSGLSALRHMARYGPVTAEGITAEVREDESSVLLTVEIDDPVVERVRHLTELLVGGVRRVFREGSTQPVAPLQVTFRHAAPRDVQYYEEFFGCRVDFGAPGCGMRFPRAPLLLPMLGSDPRVEARLVEVAESELRRIAPELPVAVAEQVRIAIENQERPLQHTIAKNLGMAGRTLQRRLQEEGASFRAIVDEVRRGLAVSMLRDPRNRVVDVAFAVGFEDATSFAKAFRRWAGESPTDYQARQTRRDAT